MQETSRTVEALPRAVGWIDILTVFVDPERAFHRVLKQGTWFPAYLVSALLATGVAAWMMQNSMSVFEQGLAQAATAQAEQMRAFMFTMTKVAPIIGGILGPLIAGALMALVYGALGLFIGSSVPSGSFRSYFTLACFARLPQVVAQALGVGGMILFHLQTPLIFSPVVLFPNLAPQSLAYSLLSTLDVFMIWSIILATVGLAVIHGRKVREVVAAGVVLYLLSLSLSVSLSLIAAAFSV